MAGTIEHGWPCSNLESTLRPRPVAVFCVASRGIRGVAWPVCGRGFLFLCFDLVRNRLSGSSPVHLAPPMPPSAPKLFAPQQRGANNRRSIEVFKCLTNIAQARQPIDDRNLAVGLDENAPVRLAVLVWVRGCKRRFSSPEHRAHLGRTSSLGHPSGHSPPALSSPEPVWSVGLHV